MASREQTVKEYKGFRYVSTVGDAGLKTQHPAVRILSFVSAGESWVVTECIISSGNMVIENVKDARGNNLSNTGSVRQVSLQKVSNGQKERFAVVSSLMVGVGEWSHQVSAFTDELSPAVRTTQEEIKKIGLSIPPEIFLVLMRNFGHGALP
jgi:hypothetical protein